YACSDSLLLTPLCCDDIHEVTPRVFALAGCDRLVSEPLVIKKYAFWDIGYYRSFIANSSKVDKPLTSLTQKIRKYEWVKEQEEAFQTLKDNICDTPILSLPDESKEFVVYCDTLNQGLGCVLMQRGKVENATAEMLCGLDQLLERKEGEVKSRDEISLRRGYYDNCALSRDLEAAFEYPGERYDDVEVNKSG
ncbi:putative reverse transcriptase domain-containing protein, partial [Tanacetum coccineum]